MLPRTEAAARDLAIALHATLRRVRRLWPPPLRRRPDGRPLRQAVWRIFFSKAVAITFEDAVIGSVQRSGIKVPLVLARAVGYVWAIAWLSFSWPWLFNWRLYAGVTDGQYLPISLIDRIAPYLGATAARLATASPLGAQA